MGPLLSGDPERVGNYRLLGRIGAGGMGVVYLARTAGGRAVAVKVVRERFAADAQFRARFRREVAAARRVTGVSTAAVLDADPDAAQPWLATAYLPGITLREAVRTVGTLPPATVRVLAAAVAEALVDIHRVGLVHRDLKPANIMVTDDGVRVIDFGIARPDDATAITSVGTVVGTPGFMSPEQVTGAAVGPASDIFSFGAVVMYSATGQEPFGSGAVDVTLRRVRTVATDLDAVTDPGLRGLVGACLRANPRERPTAAEVLDRFGPGTAVDSGWLPPVLAEEIDRRAPLLAQPREAQAAQPREEEPGQVTGPTIEPVVGGGRSVAARRQVLIGGGAAITCVTLGLGWMYGRDRPNGAQPAPTPPTSVSVTPTATPRAVERWRVKVSDYFPRELYALPGIVFAYTDENEFSAHDAATGRELWKHTVSLAAIVAGGMVFESQSANPRLALLDAATGATRWSTPAGGDGPAHIAVNGSVIGYGFNTLRAVSAGDGRPLWTADVDNERGLLAVADVLVGATETAVVAADAATGTVRWRFPVTNLQEISADAGLVFVVDGNRNLHALRAGDGTTAWRKDGFIASSGPLVRDSTIYMSARYGEVFALEPATGNEIWSQRLDYSADLTISGDTVCAATGAVVFGLRVADGRLLWTYSADMARDPRIDNGVMTGVDGRFFLGVRAGEVIAIGGAGAGA